MQSLLDQKRITRLKEVRQLEKEAASQLRQAVKKCRSRHSNKVKNRLKEDFESDKENQVQVLQREMDRRLEGFGGGHQLEGVEDCGVKKEICEEVGF